MSNGFDIAILKSNIADKLNDKKEHTQEVEADHLLKITDQSGHIFVLPIQEENLSYRYHQINLLTVGYKMFLESNKPEQKVLPILGGILIRRH